MSELAVLSLFSGIGALDLALERAGMVTVGQVEIDPWCRRILDRHWPAIPKHDDVRTGAEWWAQARPDVVVDVVSGGPPCQPFSQAGLSAGADDDRNGWPWFLNVIAAVRPRYVIAENAAEMLNARHHAVFSEVLGTLADLGFAVEWDCVSACSVAAPHARRRLCLVAYPDRCDGQARMGFGAQRSGPVQSRTDRARAWRDRVDGTLATAGSDDRNADGSAGRMVKAGGNAVVVDLFAEIGSRVVAYDRTAA